MHGPQNQRLAQIPCGSGLAREGGVSVSESVAEPPLSQASHTWVMHGPQNQRLAQIPCGSGLAREGGVSVSESITEPPLSQASQLPHWLCMAHKISVWHSFLWGLPAKAVCQSVNLQLNHRFRRQASSHTGYAWPTESAPGTVLMQKSPVTGAGLLLAAKCCS